MPDSIAILMPAMLAGLLVLATHVPLGQMVLARGIVFIDIAIAQVAALGVVAGHAFLGGETYGFFAQASATAAALLAAGFLAWTERRAGTSQEAIIGVVFVVAAAAQIVLLSFDTHGAEHLKDLLVGQILWVAPRDLLPIAALYALVLFALRWGDLTRRRLLLLCRVRRYHHRIRAACGRAAGFRFADRAGIGGQTAHNEDGPIHRGICDRRPRLHLGVEYLFHHRRPNRSDDRLHPRRHGGRDDRFVPKMSRPRPAVSP